MTKQLKLSQLSNAFSKWECTTVKLQKESKMTYYISSWIPILIVSSILV